MRKKRFLSREDIASVRGMSSRQAAIALDCGKTTVNQYRMMYQNEIVDDLAEDVKILTLDIEWRPMLSYHWGLWDQNISMTQIVDDGGLLCFAAKWLGSDEVAFYGEFTDGHDKIVREAHRLLSEADILVTYNGDRYDIRRLNQEFMFAGMAPPRPYKSIDLIRTNKNRFDLPSRKLDYIAQRTGVGAKVDNGGFQLWIDCMNGDPEAWKLMEEYNRQDVIVTEGTYLRLLPWLTNSPHIGMFSAKGDVCPYCGSSEIATDGMAHTNVQSYVMYNCRSCGGWSRGTKRMQEATGTRAIR